MPHLLTSLCVAGLSAVLASQDPPRSTNSLEFRDGGKLEANQAALRAVIQAAGDRQPDRPEAPDADPQAPLPNVAHLSSSAVLRLKPLQIAQTRFPRRSVSLRFSL